MTLGCKARGIKISEFVGKTQFLFFKDFRKLNKMNSVFHPGFVRKFPCPEKD